MPSSAGEPASFSREVLPVLSEHCFQCHGPDEKARKAKLRLDTREGLFEKGKDGAPAVVAGRGGQSKLILRIESARPDEMMPPPEAKHPLRKDQIVLLRRWIDEGARWGAHWAFERPVRPPLPRVKQRSWPRNTLDFFVLNRMEREGLRPSPEASTPALVRRASLDLLGLPPTSQDVEAVSRGGLFRGAYEGVVDRFLDSPHYGERMAWDWLEAARYADSNGYQGDLERTMWPWRDWVVKAFNQNLSFDQFTVWQLAGDLLPQSVPEQKLATGFLRNHMINGEGGRIAEENRVDYAMDMSETTGTVWLGLTFNCCRCHDHKFDALTQRDYYRMLAFFNQTSVDGGGGNPQTPPVLEVATAEQQQRTRALRDAVKDRALTVHEFETGKFERGTNEGVSASREFKELPKEIQEALSVEPVKRDANHLGKLIALWKTNDVAYFGKLEALRKAVVESADHARIIPQVMVMEDRREPRETFVLFKGLYDKPGEKVGMGVPASLPQLQAGAPTNRLGLAQWIVSAENPLTARVVVNRIWQQFFGVGLVKTSEDFGVQGEKPVNAELLDWLAVEFRESGWDMKRLCRLIVTSATYRQGSRATPELMERDPQNRFLSRGPRFRMPSWMLRDIALSASGLLETTVEGPPVKPYQPPGVWEEATFGAKQYHQDKGAGLHRRSLYTFWRRIVAPPLFFDTASRQTCTVKQPRTNTPLQSLTTLNDVTYVEAARALAQHVIEEAGADRRARVTLAFRKVLGRGPSPQEAEVLNRAVLRYEREFRADPSATEKLLAVGESKRSDRLDPAEHAGLTLVCGSLLNLDEALTKE
ncbi:MAG: PSD1 domain-containing protein [Verrucomicrobia bacterium]|nr:PSD1 domain-containing protein [Verrucomicrobiota bacterium]